MLRLEGNREEIEGAYRAETDKKAGIKLLAIQLGMTGKYTTEKIAEILHQNHVTISRWIKAFREGGLERLLERKKGTGRPCSLSDEHKKTLLEGLEAGRWRTAAQAHEALKQQGCPVKINDVYYWLHKLGGHLKVPRKSHVKKNPEAVESFKRELEPQLKEIVANLPDPQKPVRVWVEDEGRYGLITVIRKMWGLKRKRIIAPYQGTREASYLYGALEVTEGQSQFLFEKKANLETTDAFLREMVASEPNAYHIILWDNASFHPKPAAESLPETVRLLPFPPRSPELNLSEKLWDILKDGIANKAFKTLEILEETITAIFEPFISSCQRVKQLLGNNWLTQGVSQALTCNTS